ncbi:MAG: hypothetical protein HUN04_08500 [Desulfobacter sp.]|nr:MAG: hypothetical protein HUN04_08500 [Desulfobacter sp.]
MDNFPGKMVFIEFRHYPVTPEFGLYSCCYLADQTGMDMEDMAVVFVQDAGDLKYVTRALDSALSCPDASVSVFLWHYWHCMPNGTEKLFFECIALLKADPRVRIITGGLHQTLVPQIFANSQLFHCVVRGFPWESDGWFKKDVEGIVEPCYPMGFGADFRLSRAYHRLLNPLSTLRKEVGGMGTGYYLSLGCSSGCLFCHQTAFCKRKSGLAAKPLDMIWADLEFLYSTHQVTRIDVLDANIMEFTDLKTSFLAQIAAHPYLALYNTLGMRVTDMDCDTVNMVRRAGIETVFFGLETLDPVIQKKIGKPYDVAHLGDVIEYGHTLGLGFEGNILVGVDAVLGDPVDSEKLSRCIRNLTEFYGAHPNLRVQMRPYMPYWGTPLGDRLWQGIGASPESFQLSQYLDLLNCVLFGLPLKQGLKLPPCYSDQGVYDTVCKAHEAFRSLAWFKSAVYGSPPKNESKRAYCRVVHNHCLSMAEKMFLDFSGFLDESLKLLAHWR